MNQETKERMKQSLYKTHVAINQMMRERLDERFKKYLPLLKKLDKYYKKEGAYVTHGSSRWSSSFYVSIKKFIEFKGHPQLDTVKKIRISDHQPGINAQIRYADDYFIRNDESIDEIFEEIISN